MRSNNRNRIVSVIGMFVLAFMFLAPVAASADTPIKCVDNCKNGTTIVSGDNTPSDDGSSSQEDDSTPSTNNSEIEPYDGSQPQDGNLPVSCVQGVGCESGNHHGGNDDGVVLTNRFYAQGMTGVGERVAWDVTVPDDYDLVVEGVIVRIDGTMLNDEGSVVWIADGDRHIDITDGAWAVVREELAKDEACTRYVSNLRRNNAMTALFIPVDQETDCSVDLNSLPQSNDGSSNGDNASDDTTNGQESDNSGATTGSRTESGQGMDLRFEAGQPVVGTDITLDDGRHFSECYMANPPTGGTVNTGVVFPDEGETNAPQGACPV